MIGGDETNGTFWSQAEENPSGVQRPNLVPVPPPSGVGPVGNRTGRGRGRLGRPRHGKGDSVTLPPDEGRFRGVGGGGGVRHGIGGSGSGGASSAGDWPDTGSPSTVLRPEIPRFSFENLKWDASNLREMARTVGKISPDVAHANRLVRRLCNTDMIVSVKRYVEGEEQAEPTMEDAVATKIAHTVIHNAGQYVQSDIPGAMGGLHALSDRLFNSLYSDGAAALEFVMNPDRTGVANIVAFDPLTFEARRDPAMVGNYRMGQRQVRAVGGWQELNPNLVSYASTSTFYGEPEHLTALHILPLWMGYFGKLSIFLNRAAFGFLDGVVKIEVLQEIWRTVSGEVRRLYDNDFMTWAQAMVEFLAESYKDQEEADPDAIQAHLDLLELKAEATGKASFPIAEAAKVMKNEIYNATGTPGELLGEPAAQGDRFTSMKIGAYAAYLTSLQKVVAGMYNRALEVHFRAMGYPARVKPDCKFKPIPIDDELTQSQARQLQIICERMLRDEGLISQNEMSRNLIGKPAIGPAPLSEGTDQDGPSAPSREVMAQRNTAKSQQKGDSGGGDSGEGGAASGPSFGGAKRGRDSDRNAPQDKKAQDALFAGPAGIEVDDQQRPTV